MERLQVLSLSSHVSCFSLRNRLIDRDSGMSLKALACTLVTMKYAEVDFGME